MPLLPRKRICVVVGCKSTSAKWSPYVERTALEAGRMAAETGFVVLTGGHSGVMEAAARGAQEAGGLTIGILTDDHDRNANKYLDIVLPSGMGVGRNYLTALAADVMIAVPGGTGTLEEMCYAHDFGKPLLSWNSWTVLPDVPFVSQMDDYPTVRKWLQTQWLLLHAPKPQGEIR